MVDPSNVRLVGTLAPYRDGLWAELLALGYTPLSGMSLVRLMSSLSRWLEGKGLEPKELDSRRIDDFLKHRRASGCTCWLSLQGPPHGQNVGHEGPVTRAPATGPHYHRRGRHRPSSTARTHRESAPPCRRPFGHRAPRG